MIKKLSFNSLKFKKFNNHEEIKNLNSYITQFIKENPYTKLSIGTTSYQQEKKYVYISIIALFYSTFYKKNNTINISYDKGSHLIYTKNIHKCKNINETDRLCYESEYSIFVANNLKNNIDKNLIEIYLNLNQETTYKNNEIYNYYYEYINLLKYKCIAEKDIWINECSKNILKTTTKKSFKQNTNY